MGKSAIAAKLTQIRQGHSSLSTAAFLRTLQELGSQNLDDFVHIVASCSPIFEQLEAGLSVSALKEVVRIVGWVRPDWRRVADYFRLRLTLTFLAIILAALSISIYTSVTVKNFIVCALA